MAIAEFLKTAYRSPLENFLLLCQSTYRREEKASEVQGWHMDTI